MNYPVGFKRLDAIDAEIDDTIFKENISNGHIPVAEIDENHPAVKYMAENEPNIRGGVVTINYTKEFKA